MCGFWASVANYTSHTRSPTLWVVPAFYIVLATVCGNPGSLIQTLTLAILCFRHLHPHTVSVYCGSCVPSGVSLSFHWSMIRSLLILRASGLFTHSICLPCYFWYGPTPLRGVGVHFCSQYSPLSVGAPTPSGWGFPHPSGGVGVYCCSVNLHVPLGVNLV